MININRLNQNGYTTTELKNEAEKILLFYKLNKETIIWGLDYDGQFFHIGHIELESDLRYHFSAYAKMPVKDVAPDDVLKKISNIKRIVQQEEDIDYLDPEMKRRIRFTNPKTIIKEFAAINNFIISQQNEKVKKGGSQ